MNQQDEYLSIFEESLWALESGVADIDSLATAHPQYADLLRRDLEGVAWILAQKSALEPRPGFIRASRHRLVQALEQDEVADPVLNIPRESFVTWLQSLFTPGSLSFRFVSLAIILSFLLVYSSGVALASQASLPGDVLYPVKRGLEEAVIIINPDPSADVELHIEYTRRRIVEIETLAEKGRYEDIPEAVNNLEVQINHVVREMDGVAQRNLDQAKSLANDFEVTLDREKGAIVQLASSVPSTHRAEISRVVDLSERGSSAAREVLGRNPEKEGGPKPSATITPTETPTETSTATATATRTRRPTRTLRPTSTERTPNTHKPPTKTPAATKTPKPTKIDKLDLKEPTPTIAPRPTLPVDLPTSAPPDD